MSRHGKPDRGSKGRRPRRSASNTHVFKYQLTGDPRRAEENELKRALQQSIEDQIKSEIQNVNHVVKKKCDDSLSKSNIITPLQASNNSSISIPTSSQIAVAVKESNLGRKSRSPSTRSRCNSPLEVVVTTTSSIKKRKTNDQLNHMKCNQSSPYKILSPIPLTKVVKTYSRQQDVTPKISNSKSVVPLQKSSDGSFSSSISDSPASSNSNQSKSGSHSKAIITKRKSTSWSLLGKPEEKFILIHDDHVPRKVLSYPAIKHVKGDIINVRDSVLVKSGAKKTDLPFIAKICAFWKDLATENVMMSLLWYYRPEHTEEGRKPNQLMDEVFASRHKDMDSVECIEDKCYVLTFNEYCRYRKRCKMEEVETDWNLTEKIIPDLKESYPRWNRIPDCSVNSELVFCCRQIYDSRYKKLIKNPLINPKYGNF